MEKTPAGPAAPRPAARPMRADARRNYERLLAEARDSFAKHGADVFLDDIAKRAGVGVATLYRHFPTREALLDAVAQDWTEAVLTEARELVAGPDPAAALAVWLRSLVSHMSVYRGLVAALVPSMGNQNSPLNPSCQVMAEAGTLLLEHGQQAGVIRPDATTAEVLQLVSGVAWVCEQSGGSADVDRLLSFTMDSLRCPAVPAVGRAAA
ncbi:TetR/AcrR family transcriptional regulator [Streptacidiphilus sp. P02-A3a]|uniref:TetR/AcrR family transcriptional regulator n=1 Tax=Streptacidiphilus sp. P02-A3a TaxID=2704468 RepID=UPI001CDD1914|nr:TetR/AcrR family transcriptional regulator [Streptacidiphilus sp. P02-A3a]